MLRAFHGHPTRVAKREREKKVVTHRTRAEATERKSCHSEAGCGIQAEDADFFFRVRSRMPTGTVARASPLTSAEVPFGALIFLDTYMRGGVYKGHGIGVRNHCGAEPPRYIEPPGLVPTVGWRDRASAWYAAADRVKAPAGAARGRFRGIQGGRTAPSLPAET